MPDTVHLDTDTVHLAPSLAGRAWIARRFTFDDAKGRRLLFRLSKPHAKNGGYWYASHYAGENRFSYGTANVYAGPHRRGPRAKRPPCLTKEGLRQVEADLDRMLDIDDLDRMLNAEPVRRACPHCGR